MGGIELNPVSVEITYGPERLCLMLDGGASFWEDLEWAPGTSYKDVNYDLELQHNIYNFEVADVDMLAKLFEMYEAESKRVIETSAAYDKDLDRYAVGEGEDSLSLVYPAFDMALKCSHVFNVLDARGALSPSERGAYINRIRARARACCVKYVKGLENVKETNQSS
jgi:glycyl-tRNA synthetase alpha chain